MARDKRITLLCIEYNNNIGCVVTYIMIDFKTESLRRGKIKTKTLLFPSARDYCARIKEKKADIILGYHAFELKTLIKTNYISIHAKKKKKSK